MKTKAAMDLDILKAMNRKIEETEKAVMELKKLGRGAPVIEKNVRSILSLTHALRFGISDLAETEGLED
jgi:hypothetical protein